VVLLIFFLIFVIFINFTKGCFIDIFKASLKMIPLVVELNFFNSGTSSCISRVKLRKPLKKTAVRKFVPYVLVLVRDNLVIYCSASGYLQKERFLKGKPLYQVSTA
jgi:hypothetical protein